MLYSYKKIIRKELDKILNVTTTGKNGFCFHVFGRGIVVYNKFLIMSFLTENYRKLPASAENIRIEKLSAESIRDFEKENFPTYQVGVLRKYLIESPGSGEFFGLRAEDGNLAGTIGIIYRGGKYGGFSVNITDALIVNVFVSDKYRRRGFCSEMLREILKYLSTEKNITETRLYVHADNRPAIFAYKKAGGSEIFQVKKMKVMKIPFPLHGYDL